jgi:diguanylate cyclase (GGDEF)-like protein
MMGGAARVRASILVGLAALALLVPGSLPAQSPRLDSVRLKLKWRHQFQFAGYYAALERGYYRDAGLVVTIEAARPGDDPVQDVLSRKADFGVASSELVVHYARGAPVVVLAVIFQHSPLTLFARRDAGIEGVHDLVGKRVALASSEAELFAYLAREGVPVSRLERVEHDFSVTGLLEGRIDALAGYSTDELWSLRGAVERYVQLSPRSSGIDFYGDALFTSRGEIALAPGRVEAFRAASLRGWAWALSHPAEAAALVHERYAPDLPIEKLRFEAQQTTDHVQPDLVEIGHNYQGRWQHILETYQGLGMVPRDESLDLEGLIYRPATPFDVRAAAWGVLGGGVAVAIVGWIAARFYRLNRGLARQLEENRLLQEELRQLAMVDPLTRLYNRRHLIDTAERELARARREGSPLGLVMIDVDGFKEINDVHGHAAGDQVLERIGDHLRASCRGSDLPCRYGGDEFVVVMAGAGAEVMAERVAGWLAQVAAITFRGHGDFRVTFSAGVASYPKHAETPDGLLRAADEAVYAAKEAGRNRVNIAVPPRPETDSLIALPSP